jgi:Kef-type K+ transport system membrane component KefB
MALMTSIFVLLVTAHVLGSLSARIGLPRLAGHMLAGIALGPSMLNWLAPSSSLGAVSDVAVLFVVLTAGLEMRLQHVLDVFRGRGIGALLIGFVVPLSAGAAVAYAFSLATVPAIVVALCVAVTALPVALQILSGFNMLGTQIARVSISGSLLADIIVFMVLGVLIELSAADRATTLTASAVFAFGKLVVLIAAIGAAHYLCVRLMKRNVAKANGSALSATSAKLAFVLLFVLALGALSETLGFHFAIGSFFAAMMISAELIGEQPFERLEGTCEVLTASLFGPLFLAYQGMQFQLNSLARPGFVGALLIGAVVSKLISGYVVGRLQHMSKHDSWGVGIVMNARGVMELVVASIALRAGLVDREVFSALLVVGLVTTVLTPLMLKRWQAGAPVAVNTRELPPSR